MTTDLPPTPAAPGFVRAHPVLAAVLALVAVIAIALPTVVVLTAPTPTRIAKKIQKHQRVVPPAELPPVEPVSYINLAPGDAWLINAAVPFSTDPNPAAKPCRLPIAETDADRARALVCLAAAVFYETGDDAQADQSDRWGVHNGR